MKLSEFFDYIYYRVGKFYMKWDGEDAFTAVISVSMVQVMTPCALLTALSKLFFSREDTYLYARQIAYIGVAILTIVTIYNNQKYKGKYAGLKEKWHREPCAQRRKRGWLVFLSMLFPNALIVVIAKFT